MAITINILQNVCRGFFSMINTLYYIGVFCQIGNLTHGLRELYNYSSLMKKLFSNQEVQFILIFCGIFLVTISILTIVGLIPSELKVNGGETFEQKTRTAVREIIEGKPATSSVSQSTSLNTSANTASVKNTIYAENPIRIVIPAISVDSAIVNPGSTNHEVLDSSLTKGVVRYPGSGFPGSGNMFLFGHSTGFSVVQNKAYKVFNNLQNLKSGDRIEIYGAQGIYTYQVRSVKKVNKDNALVTFDTKNNMITLSTCDSFGKASDRFVVEGDFVSVIKR